MSSLFILFDAFTHSDSIGKFIFIILFSLSIVTWTILVQKLLLFSKVRRTCAFIWEKLQQPSSNLLQIEAFPNQIPYGHLIHILKQKTTEVLEKRRFFSKEDKVFLSNQDITLIENHLEITTDIELKKLGKNLYVLHTIVSLAPFVGILGTVWGILLSL
ncbi:MAG: MotA/TolQ/ExbB proton channel family protein, partial [Simkaniaceae bacterium]|nr:MotA/TolQ/ExbB proton channel family protein [Simkaniaceae bacterium]